MIRVTHLLIPPQAGTFNTVEMLEDQIVANALLGKDLLVVGWIHTHPTQTAFLSSIDVHTQYSYQALLKEAVAVVCAPSYGVVKWLRLTEAGMRVVAGCDMSGFHEHFSKYRLYQPALYVSFYQDDVAVLNLRGELRETEVRQTEVKDTREARRVLLPEPADPSVRPGYTLGWSGLYTFLPNQHAYLLI